MIYSFSGAHYRKSKLNQEAPKKRNGDKDDNWDDYEVDLPYCKH